MKYTKTGRVLWKRWSDSEIQTLKELISLDIPAYRIARFLNRTERSVDSKIHQLKSIVEA